MNPTITRYPPTGPAVRFRATGGGFTAWGGTEAEAIANWRGRPPQTWPARATGAGLRSADASRESLLRIFIRHDAPLSDGTALAPGCVIDQSGCAGKSMSLKILDRTYTLAYVGMREVSAGDQLRFVTAAGGTHDQTFGDSGIVVDFPLTAGMLGLVKKVMLGGRNLEKRLGVSTCFKTLASRGRLTTDARFDGISLTPNRAEHDEAAEFFLIEV